MLDASTLQGKVTDYEKHIDRIDLSDWGNVYSAAALTITSSSSGATVSFGSHQVQLTTVDGHSLTAADFADADFLF